MVDEKKESYLAQVESGKVMTDDEALKDAEKALSDAIKQRDLEIEEQALQKELQVIVNDNLRKLEPENAYQAVEEYWAIQKALHQIKFNKELINFENKLSQLDKFIKAREERVKELKGEEK